ncbi:hypothetical protein ACTFIV_007908 [Dictyostelium citrinum]
MVIVSTKHKVNNPALLYFQRCRWCPGRSSSCGAVACRVQSGDPQKRSGTDHTACSKHPHRVPTTLLVLISGGFGNGTSGFFFGTSAIPIAFTPCNDNEMPNVQGVGRRQFTPVDTRSAYAILPPRQESPTAVSGRCQYTPPDDTVCGYPCLPGTGGRTCGQTPAVAIHQIPDRPTTGLGVDQMSDPGHPGSLQSEIAAKASGASYHGKTATCVSELSTHQEPGCVSYHDTAPGY